MIPTKQRRSIEAAFDEHGYDLELKMDDRLPDGAFHIFIDDADIPVAVGSTRMINWARDIQRNAFVPETYSDEASTWA